jgi:hypothetical protein
MHVLRVLGLPLHTTRHTPLYDLLKFPDVTTDCGSKELRGVRAIQLTIGPGIPASFIEGHPLWEHAWVKLWLAIDKHCLPLRTEIYMKVRDDMNASFYAKRGVAVLSAPDADGKPAEYYRLLCDVEDIRDVKDVVRDEWLPFPWRMTVVSGLTLNIACEHVELNVPFAPSEFKAAIPADYALTSDGEIVRARISSASAHSGGSMASAGSAGREARELLASTIPESPADTNAWMRWIWAGIGMCCFVVGFVVFCLRRRGNV